MGARQLFSSVTQLLVSQWTTPLNELMPRSGSNLEINPGYQLSAAEEGAYVTLRVTLCNSTPCGPFRYGVNSMDSHNSCEADDTLPEADTSKDNGYRSLYQSTKATFTNPCTPRSYSELWDNQKVLR